MTKLVIKKRGLFINILGVAQFRTPAEVDISNVDIKLVIAELNKNGIREYEIKTKDVKSLRSRIESLLSSNKEITIIDEKDGIIIDTKNDEILNLVKSQADTIRNIEGLLTNILSSGSNKELVKESKKIKKVEEVEEFIPSININKSKIKGTPTSSIKIKSNLTKDV